MFVLLLQVLALVALIAGSVYNSNLAVAAAGDARNTVGGWIGFVSFLVLLVELGVIAMRFINFAFVYQYPLMVMIAVSEHLPAHAAGTQSPRTTDLLLVVPWAHTRVVLLRHI